MKRAIITAASTHRIVFLDYLRIFAFVTVLIGHTFYLSLVNLAQDPTAHSTARLIANLCLPFVYGGGAGVVVFFLVSGYIITQVLQTEQTVEFLVKRAFRIYPLYMLAVIVQYALLAIAGQAPNLQILLPQLLLVGDFFGTPYTLNGVEWTLRLEIVFYVFMSLARSLNLTTGASKVLPYLLVATTIACGILAPIPSADIWSKGYVTIYGPFLLLGSMFYLFERRKIGAVFLSLFTVLIFLQYFKLIAAYQKMWLDAHFAALALLIFFVCWAARSRISAAPQWVLLLSNMTYAVYLFHNWFFDYTKKLFAHFSVAIVHPDVQALAVLLMVCFFLAKYVEKPAIFLGRVLLVRLRISQGFRR
ncbi:MAG: acyltransferase [Aeromicrobium sp.]|nr:acyltransferase [Burkholderiales bacterium]